MRAEAAVPSGSFQTTRWSTWLLVITVSLQPLAGAADPTPPKVSHRRPAPQREWYECDEHSPTFYLCHPVKSALVMTWAAPFMLYWIVRGISDEAHPETAHTRPHVMSRLSPARPATTGTDAAP